jgi:hypothetical protein
MHGHRGTNGARFCDTPPEFHQIGMCYVPVSDIDRERVRGIAASTLRVKDKIPRTVVRGPGFGSRSQREARTENGGRDQSRFHDPSPKDTSCCSTPQKPLLAAELAIRRY